MKLRLGIIFASAIAGAILLGPSPASAGGCRGGEGLTDEPGTTVEMSHSCFSPTVLRVAPGDQVTWTNTSEPAHTVSGAALSFGDYEELKPGEAISYRFDQAGVYPYFCFLHPGMVGAVVVGDGPPVGTSNASDGVKAVSAEVPGGDAPVDDAPAEVSSDDGGSDVPLIAGIAMLAAVAGFGGAWLLKRRAVR